MPPSSPIPLLFLSSSFRATNFRPKLFLTAQSWINPSTHCCFCSAQPAARQMPSRNSFFAFQMIFAKSAASSIIEVSPKSQRLLHKNSCQENKNCVGHQQKNGSSRLDGKMMSNNNNNMKKKKNKGTTTTNWERARNGKGSRWSASGRTTFSRGGGSHSAEAGERDEVRAALLRHWTSLDRARLHTFHLWLFVYALAQIFLFHYLCHRVWSLVYLCFCLPFPALVLVSFVLIRYYGDEQQRSRLVHFSLVSSVSFPIFLWLIHLPLISEFRVKQERIAELSSLCSSMAISTLYQFFVLPRQRRLFLLLSVAFNFLNTFLIGAVLYNSSDQILSREWESPVLMVIPLFIYQGLVILVGIICDSNSASSRQMIAQKLTEAVHRRNELDELKSRQDQLLLSVIPAYLTDKVSKSIFATSSEADFSNHNGNQKLFHELHVQVHENVSILFADIVNFTQLAAQLSAKDLVKTLNELYSKFDEDAQKLSCMRIKFLGDCYYCVSGMPVNRPNHADMCVLMGLEMIKTIRQVRLATGVDVDMRIGVHTGSVLCGILGLKKWQFDVWSDDVTFANQMETTGKPGALHISKKTRDSLYGDYNIVEAPKSEDPIILAHGQPTFHILPDKSTILERAASIYANKRQAMDLSPSDFDLSNADSLSMDGGLLPIGPTIRHQRAISMKAKSVKMTEYWGEQTQALTRPLAVTKTKSRRETRKPTDFENGINLGEKMTKKKDQNWNLALERKEEDATKSNNQNNGGQISLKVESAYEGGSTTGEEEGATESWALRERRRKNRAADYGAGTGTGVSMTLIENNLGSLSPTRLNILFHCTTGSCELSPYLLLPFINREFCVKSECRLILLLSIPLATANYLLVYQNVPVKVQPMVTGQILICLGILLFICALESLCRAAKVLLTMIAFVVSLFLPIGQHLCLVLLAVTWHQLPVFSILWLPSCICHMCSVFALYRLPYSMRCFLASVDCGLFLLLLVLFSTSVSNVLQSAPIISCQVTICLVNMIALFLLLLFIARITEYERKMEASCNVAFKNEEMDVQLMQDINRLLIHNILPPTVAHKFLSHNRNKDELYARDHDNVCIMFASIPNFKDYWSECDKSKKLECLRLLNEIVCEFDKLLSKPKFSCIEKIKTVASTYMAAAGLTDSDTADNSPERNTTVMVEFAQTMATVLDQLNIDSFQNFQLRIGINVGPVVAGVLGQKPQYDIWGNSVNIASRMDSSGKIGFIQVNEETKQILSRKFDYPWVCRGEINVKGKGLMRTFLLKLGKARSRVTIVK